MKKALTLSMLVGLAVATGWYVAVAQDFSNSGRGSARGVGSSETGSLTPINPFETPTPSQTDVLKQELLQLTETAASLMSEEELQAEVERARERAVTMTANQRLEEIRRELSELVVNYQGTEAAATAEAMLEVDNDVDEALDVGEAEEAISE